MSLLIVYNDVPDLETINNSLLPTTKYYLYNNNSNENDIKSLIQNNAEISRIGLMFHHKLSCNIPFFPDPQFIENNNTDNIVANSNNHSFINSLYKSKYNFYSDRLIVLMTQLLSINPNITFDIISCYFNNSDFIDETNNIKSTLNCQIEYSLDATGNQLDGGNWVLESNNINIQTIYFNSNISQWNNILASPTNYYGTDKGTGKGIYDFFNNYFNIGDIFNFNSSINYNSSTKTYTLPPGYIFSLKNTPLFGTGTDQVAILQLKDGETFDGNYCIIDLASTTVAGAESTGSVYYGLFTSSSSNDNITIKNNYISINKFIKSSLDDVKNELYITYNND